MLFEDNLLQYINIEISLTHIWLCRISVISFVDVYYFHHRTSYDGVQMFWKT